MDIFKIISATAVMFLVFWASLLLLNLLLVKRIMPVFDLERKFNEVAVASIIGSSVTTAVILVSILYGQGAFN